MNNPLNDELLHAYADNALTDEERREVEHWLAQDAEAARTLARAVAERHPAIDYLNAVARLETSLEPYGLLLHLLDIELMLGRKRRGLKKNAPRSVDLDLLLVDALMIQSTPLTLPHPRLHLRAFVLKPLLDLDPDIVIPGLGPARDFLNGVADQRIELLDTTTGP